MNTITIDALECRLARLDRKIVRAAEILVNTRLNGHIGSVVSQCEDVLEKLVERRKKLKAMIGRARAGVLDLQDVERIP